MSITLTKEQEEFVIERLGRHGYTSPQELIDAAFRALNEQETALLDHERRLVRHGLERLERGERLKFSSLDELGEQIKKEGREQWERRSAKI